MTPEEFVEDLLLHGEVYDPAKAHEYYLRTRVLKGRKHGSSKPVTGNSRTQAPSHSLAPKKTAAQLRKEAQAKTERLQARLEHLRDVLARLVKEAERRSGVKTPNHSAASKTSSHHETAKEKAEKKASYERHKNDANKKHQSLSDKQLQSEIDQVRAKIRAIRAQIQKSIDDARKKAAGRITK